MRVGSDHILAQLVGAAVLTLSLGCGTNSPPGADDEVRLTLNNTSSVTVDVAIVTSHGTTNVTVAAGVQEDLEITGRANQQITFQASAPGSVGGVSCIPNAVIVTTVNTSPLPNALYGQVDFTVTAPTIQVNCTGGLGEWQ